MQRKSVIPFIITLFLCLGLAASGCSDRGEVNASTAAADESGTPGAKPDSDIVARVGDQEITFNQLNTLLNSSAVVGLSIPSLGAPERDTARILVLDKFISANLVYLDAVRKGLDRDPGYQRDITRFSDSVLAGFYWDSLLDDEVVITEEQIEAMFRQSAKPGEELTDSSRSVIVSTLRKAQRQAAVTRAKHHLREGIRIKWHEENYQAAGDEERADDAPVVELDEEILTWGQLRDPVVQAGKGAVIADPMADEDAARRAALEREIDIHLLVSKAKAEGLETDPVYLRRYNEYRKNHLINLHREQLVESIYPDDDTLKAYFEEHKSRFILPESRKLQMVVVDNENLAATLKSRIEAGEITMYQAAREHSIAANAQENLGEVGWVNQGDLVPELDKVVFSLDPAVIGGPVETPAGWHLVLVQDLKDAEFTDFSETATNRLVLRRYLDDKLNEYTAALRTNDFTVEVYEDRMVQLAQMEADMAADLTSRAEEPGSVTSERLKELQKYLPQQ